MIYKSTFADPTRMEDLDLITLQTCGCPDCLRELARRKAEEKTLSGSVAGNQTNQTITGCTGPVGESEHTSMLIEVAVVRLANQAELEAGKGNELVVAPKAYEAENEKAAIVMSTLENAAAFKGKELSRLQVKTRSFGA